MRSALATTPRTHRLRLHLNRLSRRSSCVSRERTGPGTPQRPEGSAVVAQAGHYRGVVPAYLDAASGAPLHPVAREALLAALDDGWADPGRLYGAGRRAATAARRRPRVDRRVRRGPSGRGQLRRPNGTQALHAAVLGLLPAPARRATFVHSAVEHSASCTPPISMSRAVDGRVDRCRRAWPGRRRSRSRRRPTIRRAVAAALQAANHEVGTPQPVDATRRRWFAQVPLVVDATQTLGHAPIPGGWSVLAGDARDVGRPGRRRRAGRPHRRPVASPVPGRRPRGGRVPGVPNVPAIVAAAASAAGRRRRPQRGRSGPAARRWSTGSGVDGGAHRSRRRGARRPGRPAAAHRHLLLPVRRRRGAAHRAGPARLRGVLRLVVHLVDARAVARAGRDGRADVGQRARVAAPRTTEAEVDEFLAVLPGSWPTSGPNSARPGCEPAASARDPRLPGPALPAADPRPGPAHRRRRRRRARSRSRPTIRPPRPDIRPGAGCASTSSSASRRRRTTARPATPSAVGTERSGILDRCVRTDRIPVGRRRRGEGRAAASTAR